MLSKITLILTLLGVCLWAQGGFFLSAENVRRVSNPEEVQDQSFVYRVSIGGEKYDYYEIQLSNAIYESNKVFAWPKGMSSEQKSRAKLVASEESLNNNQQLGEIIYSGEVVLTDYPEIFLISQESETGMIPLEKLDHMGIIQIAVTEASFALINEVGEGITSKLPTLYYQTIEAPTFAVLRKSGYYSQYLSMNPENKKFEFIAPNFKALPELKSENISVKFDLTKYPDKVERIRVLDSILTVLDKHIANSEQKLNSFREKVGEGFPKKIERKNFESDVLFQVRDSLYDIEKEALIVKAVKSSLFYLNLIELKNQRFLLEGVKSDAEASLQRELELASIDHHAKLLDQLVWGRFYAGVYGSLARNMPDWTADPGPAWLWKVHGRLSYSFEMPKSTTLITRLDGAYTQWQFHEQVSDKSRHLWGGGAILLGIPLAVSASQNSVGGRKGSIVQFKFGPSIGYFQSKVTREIDSIEKEGVTFGGVVGMDFFVTKLPLGLHGEYEYTNTEFGDLRMGLSIPLFFIKDLGGSE